MKTALLNFFVALRFLTILPVSWEREEDGLHFSTCLYFFPVVGLLIGVLAWGLVTVLALLLPPIVVAALLVTFFGAISGFLHLDGLADSCDGLLSARSATRSLEIMKDSNTGAMGVVGVVLLLLIKYASIASLPSDSFGVAALIIPFAGRCSLLIAMGTQKYCRPEGGLGALFYSKRCKKAAVLAASLLFIMATVVSLAFSFLFTLSVVAGIYCFGIFCRNRIGGATGDTLGATCEITETIAALVITSSCFI